MTGQQKKEEINKIEKQKHITHMSFQQNVLEQQIFTKQEIKAALIKKINQRSISWLENYKLNKGSNIVTEINLKIYNGCLMTSHATWPELSYC